MTAVSRATAILEALKDAPVVDPLPVLNLFVAASVRDSMTAEEKAEVFLARANEILVVTLQETAAKEARQAALATADADAAAASAAAAALL